MGGPSECREAAPLLPKAEYFELGRWGVLELSRVKNGGGEAEGRAGATQSQSSQKRVLTFPKISSYNLADVAQLVEQSFRKAKVGGSIPPIGSE